MMDRATLAVVLLAACGPSGTTSDRAELVVKVANGVLTAPDTIAPGWTRLRVEEDGDGHIVVAFQLLDSTSGAAERFLGELDTATVTPTSAIALGGPEIGDTGEVVLELLPGRYLLGCVRRESAGHRHASTGEAKVVVVTGTGVPGGRTSAPVAQDSLVMSDFAFGGTDHWNAGPGSIRIENVGTQDHQLRLDRLNDGASLQQWISSEDPSALAVPIVGIARMGKGRVAYLPVDLRPGIYVAYCLITDPGSRRMHVEMGMFRTIQVE